MIRMKHQQPSLWETFFAEEVADLCEPWMRAVDELLEDDELVGGVYDAQGMAPALVVSSGVIEAGCKTVIGSRLKRPALGCAT
jgi:hypothetical protein